MLASTHRVGARHGDLFEVFDVFIGPKHEVSYALRFLACPRFRFLVPRGFPVPDTGETIRVAFHFPRACLRSFRDLEANKKFREPAQRYLEVAALGSGLKGLWQLQTSDLKEATFLTLMMTYVVASELGLAAQARLTLDRLEHLSRSELSERSRLMRPSHVQVYRDMMREHEAMKKADAVGEKSSG